MVTELNKNFRLIAFSRLLQELIFWYSIFIAFAYSINMKIEQLALAIVAINLGVILFEVPSGVLADRWSRKWTLAIGTGILMLSSLVFSLSSSATTYMIASFLWGVFFAFQSGTPESLIYDLLKTEDKTKQYKRYLARYSMLGTIGLIIGSISGSIIAELISLRSAYLLTLIPSALSLIPLALVKEPITHHESQQFNSRAHYGVAFRQLVANNSLIVAVLASILIVSAISFIFELNQIYYFAAGLPIALYGVFNASLQFSIAGGSWLASKRSGKTAILFAILLLLFLCMIILMNLSIFSSALLSIVLLLLFYTTNIYGHFIQDQVTSEVRSAATSMVSSGGRLVFTGLILLFGSINISKEHVNGFVILVALVVVIAILTLVNVSKLDSFNKTQRS